MSELLTQIPWLVNIAEFGVMAFIVIRVITVLDHALARAQAPETVGSTPSPPAPTPGKAKPPSSPSPAPIPSPSPSPDVVVDEKFLAFLREQEGFAPTAKWDYKQWTNGYGTKAKFANETITREEAEIRLVAEATAAAQFVHSHFPGVTTGEEQAMIDFTFNLGEEWINDPVGKLLAAGDIEGVKTHMKMYVHAGKPPVVLDALVRRREAEVQLFDHPL